MRNSCPCSGSCCYFSSLVALALICISMSLFLVLGNSTSNRTGSQIPLAINTWSFTNATAAAWDALYHHNQSALDAVEIGCSVCEREQCDFTVGYGGSPDENGETTLDAFIMDGMTMDTGAVGALRNVTSAISVARHVLENTQHSILVGELATQFAINMGFKSESLSTIKSEAMWKEWQGASCQPNYWTNVSPDPKQQCGPYKPKSVDWKLRKAESHQLGHDTISMITIDRLNQIAVGTSSNGANHKIPGRVGDAPIVGAGGYADGSVGGAACTGDGDVMMRFLPSFLAVEEMRRGTSPGEATRKAISRIKQYYPSFSGAIIAANMRGEYAAACHGMDQFPFSVHNPEHPDGTVVKVPCI